MAEHCPMCGSSCDIKGHTTKYYVPHERGLRATLGDLIGKHEELRRQYEELKHRLYLAEKIIMPASRIFYREGEAWVDWQAAHEMREALKGYQVKQTPD